MRTASTILAMCLILFGACGSGSSPDGTTPDPAPIQDEVHEACVQYEKYFRQASGTVAKELESGQLTTDTESFERRKALLAEARRIAFGALAKKEAEAFQPWTPAKEAEILRSYEAN